MPVATITCQYINEPKPGKKSGSIKTAELGYISVWADKLPYFEKGQRYTVEYSINGDFKNFVRMAASAPQQIQSGGYNPPPAPTQVTYRQPPQPNTNIRDQQPYRPVPPYALDPQPQTTAVPAPPLDITALNIFTTGLVGRALGSGHFSPDDIDRLTENAVAAFKRHLANPKAAPVVAEKRGTRAVQYVDPELNDPLPDANFYNPEAPPFP